MFDVIFHSLTLGVVLYIAVVYTIDSIRRG
jgi:hypothetical protein